MVGPSWHVAAFYRNKSNRLYNRSVTGLPSIGANRHKATHEDDRTHMLAQPCGLRRGRGRCPAPRPRTPRRTLTTSIPTGCSCDEDDRRSNRSSSATSTGGCGKDRKDLAFFDQRIDEGLVAELEGIVGSQFGHMDYGEAIGVLE